MSSPPWTVRPVSYLDPVVQQLVSELNAEERQRYGANDAGPSPVTSDEFAYPSGTFLLLQDAQGVIGCGGIRTHGADAEIKRIYIRQQRRRHGFARHLMVALEEYARGRSFSRIILETGTAQPEAMALYDTLGYIPIQPYGHYRDYPESRCYAKWLI
ncbi:GNAT family N-acetyltransferase [Demetria terragena]|uniref:GNAT family N-acetyltransferase n=1 Tax=Demetria terragena TaxID=63959 RepID=UPI0014615109|nr:GNAT family N-acetyltransferase [Demetria terragena]